MRAPALFSSQDLSKDDFIGLLNSQGDGNYGRVTEKRDAKTTAGITPRKVGYY